jgi:Tol biopolymer transport system component
MKRYLFFKCVIPIYCFLLLALSACALVPAVDSSATPMAAATRSPTTIQAEPDELLPNTLFYLAQGQVFRMARDGKTVAQITFEDVNVTDYDVSLADGSVAYVANNQLIVVNADGSNRQLLLDGGSRDENNFWVTSPVFSPDGQILAYGYKGLNLYDITTGISNLAIANQNGDLLPSGMPFPLETYSPVHYSPDGTKLLVALGHWESLPTHAVYDPGTNNLVRYVAVQEYINCCTYHGGPAWSPDSSSFYGVASVHDTVYQFGELWRVDAGNGALTTMLNTGDGTFYLPVEPYLAPDGQLYFFFGMYGVDSGFLDAPVLKLVRSAPDGVTDRTVLRDENFILMDEALWAPDASFVIVSTAPARNWNQDGGVLELYYTDGQKSAVWLAPLGYQMKWGP